MRNSFAALRIGVFRLHEWRAVFCWNNLNHWSYLSNNLIMLNSTTSEVCHHDHDEVSILNSYWSAKSTTTYLLCTALNHPCSAIPEFRPVYDFSIFKTKDYVTEMDNNFIVCGRCRVNSIYFQRNIIIFHRLKLEIALAIPASNECKKQISSTRVKGDMSATYIIESRDYHHIIQLNFSYIV